jgi:hypothetical protein
MAFFRGHAIRATLLSSVSSLFCLFLLPGIISLTAAQTDAPQTIASLDGYTQLRACAQTCFDYGNDGCAGDNVADHIGCAYGCFTVAHDSCYCRADLQSKAESWLSACIKSGCTLGGDTSIDISNAVGLYEGYCTSQGYSALQTPASTPATTTTRQAQTATTSQAQTPPTTAEVSTMVPATTVVVETVTSSSPTSSSSSQQIISESLFSRFLATFLGLLML